MLYLAGCLCGCSDAHVRDAGVDAATDPAAAAEQFERDFARTLCEAELSRCVAPVISWPSLERCLERSWLVGPLGLLSHASLVEGVRRGELGFDANAAARCLEAQASGCLVEDGTLKDTNEAAWCQLLFYSLAGGASGDPCSRNHDCARGLMCDLPDAFQCLGDTRCRPLSGPDEPCQDASECDPAILMACRAELCVQVDVSDPQPEGAQCGVLDATYLAGDCEPGLSCDLDRRCVRPAALGESCLDRACRIGGHCDDGVCVAASALAVPGSTCDETCTIQSGLVCEEFTTCIATDGSCSWRRSWLRQQS